jgi:dihydroneopterin aldolase
LYKIYIDSLKVDAIIGILDSERETPQRVEIFLEIVYEREGEGFIDYAKVAKLVEDRLIEKKYFLLEDALEDLTKELKHSFSPIKSIKIKLFKPEILNNCKVGVELFKNY